MFGTIDIPDGGKAPPAPTFLAVNGEEIQSYWLEITYNSYPGDHVYTYAISWPECNDTYAANAQDKHPGIRQAFSWPQR